MSEFQADTLRRLITRYADAARDVGRAEMGAPWEKGAALRAFDEARERLETLLDVMTKGMK